MKTILKRFVDFEKYSLLRNLILTVSVLALSVFIAYILINTTV